MMAIDFDNNETYDLFFEAFDKALQLSTVENRGRVRQMFRDQMKRVAELEVTIRVASDWQERAEVAERRWGEVQGALNHEELAHAECQARVAELEATLAAQEWRPVTEPPNVG